jgi:hypothetical protein
VKRDMDLIGDLLQMLETAATDRGFSFEEGEAAALNRTLDEIDYNLVQAEEMGLIVVGSKPLNGPWKIHRLTSEGHKFLESHQSKKEVASYSAYSSEPIIIAKPSFMGMGINFNEVWRRARSWWKNRQ